jgi:hypothetical protein
MGRYGAHMNIQHLFVGLVLTVALTSSAGALDKKPVWKTFETDNGTIFVFDPDKIRVAHNDVSVTLFEMRDGHVLLERATPLLFDCRGYYMDTSLHSGMSDFQYAPPRSVAGAISKMVCHAPRKSG